MPQHNWGRSEEGCSSTRGLRVKSDLVFVSIHLRVAGFPACDNADWKVRPTGVMTLSQGKRACLQVFSSARSIH